MNWLAFVMRALSLVPATVTAIEALKNEATSGTSKKQLAMDSLGVGTAVAQAVAPEHKDAFAAVSTIVSNAIENAVALKNAIGEFSHSPAPQTSAAAASAPAQ